MPSSSFWMWGQARSAIIMTRGHLPERVKPIIYAALTQKGYQIRADDLEILASPPATSSQSLHHDIHSGKRFC